MVRGGAYDGLAEHVRASNRASRPPDQAFPNVGFRCNLVGRPNATFEASPDQQAYDNLFWVDGSACDDPNHPSDALEVRWDWENDSTWDTSWSTGKTASHRYNSPGFYTIAMQVRDPDGNTDMATRDVIAEGSDGWDGDACEVEADCASGFHCVTELIFGTEYVCRESCFLDGTCLYPGQSCGYAMWSEGLPIQACMP